jgi:hypothetical protein
MSTSRDSESVQRELKICSVEDLSFSETIAGKCCRMKTKCIIATSIHDIFSNTSASTKVKENSLQSK